MDRYVDNVIDVLSESDLLVILPTMCLNHKSRRHATLGHHIALAPAPASNPIPGDGWSAWEDRWKRGGGKWQWRARWGLRK